MLATSITSSSSDARSYTVAAEADDFVLNTGGLAAQDDQASGDGHYAVTQPPSGTGSLLALAGGPGVTAGALVALRGAPPAEATRVVTEVAKDGRKVVLSLVDDAVAGTIDGAPAGVAKLVEALGFTRFFNAVGNLAKGAFGKVFGGAVGVIADVLVNAKGGPDGTLDSPQVVKLTQAYMERMAAENPERLVLRKTEFIPGKPLYQLRDRQTNALYLEAGGELGVRRHGDVPEPQRQAIPADRVVMAPVGPGSPPPPKPVLPSTVNPMDPFGRGTPNIPGPVVLPGASSLIGQTFGFGGSGTKPGVATISQVSQNPPSTQNEQPDPAAPVFAPVTLPPDPLAPLAKAHGTLLDRFMALKLDYDPQVAFEQGKRLTPEQAKALGEAVKAYESAYAADPMRASTAPALELAPAKAALKGFESTKGAQTGGVYDPFLPGAVEEFLTLYPDVPLQQWIRETSGPLGGGEAELERRLRDWAGDVSAKQLAVDGLLAKRKQPVGPTNGTPSSDAGGTGGTTGMGGALGSAGDDADRSTVDSALAEVRDRFGSAAATWIGNIWNHFSGPENGGVEAATRELENFAAANMKYAGAVSAFLEHVRKPTGSPEGRNLLDGVDAPVDGAQPSTGAIVLPPKVSDIAARLQGEPPLNPEEASHLIGFALGSSVERPEDRRYTQVALAKLGLADLAGDLPAARRAVLHMLGHASSRDLAAELTGSERLVRLLDQFPEVAAALIPRPKTLQALGQYPRARATFEKILSDLALQNPMNIKVPDAPIAESFPLTPEQIAISDRVKASIPEDPSLAWQTGFRPEWRDDPMAISRYITSLLERAEATRPAFKSFLETVGAATGGTPEMREAPKDRKRIEDKTMSKYGGNPARNTDLLAGRLVFDNLDDLYKALDTISRQPGVKIVFFKDHFRQRAPSGYGDLTFDIEINGFKSEVQLGLRSFDRYSKQAEHAYYEMWRDMVSQARSENRSNTPTENYIINSLRQITIAEYDRLMTKAQQRRSPRVSE